MPWSLASVASEIVALLRAVTAEAGASKMYGLFWGSGHVPSVTAVSRFTMLQLRPGEELGDGGAEGGGGVLGQVLADDTGEVDVAAEAERDGLAVALPVGVERRVLREVLGGDDGVVGRRRRGLGGGPEPPEKNAK